MKITYCECDTVNGDNRLCPLHGRTVLAAERAVIEAAREWETSDLPRESVGSTKALRAAVHALNALTTREEG